MEVQFIVPTELYDAFIEGRAVLHSRLCYDLDMARDKEESVQAFAEHDYALHHLARSIALWRERLALLALLNWRCQ
jgi:hypothetical protein